MVPAAPVATATVTTTAPAAVALSVSSARAQAEQLGPIDTVGDELPDEPDASFDVLANEIDALLGRIASRETADGRGARARAR